MDVITHYYLTNTNNIFVTFVGCVIILIFITKILKSDQSKPKKKSKFLMKLNLSIILKLFVLSLYTPRGF